jgi:glycosyltransferase involved in cell wall biosynthesis
MKVALVYDRVNKWGGAERVLLTLHEMFPEAPLFTSVYDEAKAPWAKVFPKVYTSFLQWVPFAKSNHEFFGWLMPFIFEGFSFDDYSLVISVTSEAAKGIITKPKTKHICYCLTPTRYLWSHYDLYFKNPIIRFISKPIVKYLRNWDKVASQRPDRVIAISTEVKKRIKKYYDRESEVIFPPVSFTSHQPPVTNHVTQKHFLVVSRLVPYKRVDLAIKAFNKLRHTLVIVGSGSEEKRLKSMSRSKNIKFVGQVSEEELIKYYKGARALIMPQEEEFGIVSVEAQSFGVPPVAYQKGGVKDTVIDGKTGIFFDSQTPESLIGAIRKFDKWCPDKEELITGAKRFSKERFQKSFICACFGGRWRNQALANVKRKNPKTIFTPF